MKDEPKEIERKFRVATLPEDYADYPSKKMIQGYLNREPVVRVRDEGGEYFLTYKGGGLLERIEYNLPLDQKSFSNLIKKADGIVIEKTRYYIPISDSHQAELDIFEGELAPLILVEVEFGSRSEADEVEPPAWFGQEVTWDSRYHNSTLSDTSYRQQ